MFSRRRRRGTEPCGVRIRHGDGRISECALLRDPDDDPVDPDDDVRRASAPGPLAEDSCVDAEDEEVGGTAAEGRRGGGGGGGGGGGARRHSWHQIASSSSTGSASMVTRSSDGDIAIPWPLPSTPSPLPMHPAPLSFVVALYRNGKTTKATGYANKGVLSYVKGCA